MNVIVNVILAVQMLAALAMIGLILIQHGKGADMGAAFGSCLLYTSPSPRDQRGSRMPSSA